jgi:membrane-bound lytic murein transglycosylase D
VAPYLNLVLQSDSKEVKAVKWKSLLLLGMIIFSCPKAQAEEPLQLQESVSFPSLITSLRAITAVEFCGERVPLEVQETRERLEKELLLSLWHRSQIILYLKRSRRYLPHIEAVLSSNGMPDDLKYLAIVESALRPHVRSKKGAVGFWQFMKYTGQKYGLTINERIDERRNIFASTQAAIKYFQDLHDTFGSWTLAAAAYNMGEEGLMAEMLEQGNNDYYQLYLPLETQRYIFRIIAIKIIFEDPARYGFQLSDEDYYPPMRFEQVSVECFKETPIRIIAQAAKTNFKVIKDLNPEIRGHYLAKGNHLILTPKEGYEDFQVRYQELLRNWASDHSEQTYLVKQGDNLTAIAERFDVPLPSLIIWNRLNPRSPIHPGDRLIIYPKKEVAPEFDSNDNGSAGNSFEDN